MSEDQAYSGPPLCGLTEEQVTALQAPLDREHVAIRENKFSYIEGHHAIREMNRIFGPTGWSRETLSMETVYDGPYMSRKGDDGFKVCYVAKVRVVAGGIVKEGTGFGSSITYDNIPADAYEGACKEAETDAMKRAMMMFGDPLGLALYSKDQEHVEGSSGSAAPQKSSGSPAPSAPAGGGDFGPCPECGGVLRAVNRKDGSGQFVGCANWKDKDCKFMCNVEDAPAAGATAAASPPDDIPTADEEGFPTTGAALRQWMSEVLFIAEGDLGSMRTAGAVRAWGGPPEDWKALTPAQMGELARAIKEENEEQDPFGDQ